MGSPSQNAQSNFGAAKNHFGSVMAFSYQDSDNNPIPVGLREGLKSMAAGMNDTAVALRAIYQKMEEMQAEIQQLKRARP